MNGASNTESLSGRRKQPHGFRVKPRQDDCVVAAPLTTSSNERLRQFAGALGWLR